MFVFEVVLGVVLRGCLIGIRPWVRLANHSLGLEFLL